MERDYAAEKNGRALDHKTVEQIRIWTLQRVEGGESPEVISALEFSRSCKLLVTECKGNTTAWVLDSIFAQRKPEFLFEIEFCNIGGL